MIKEGNVRVTYTISSNLNDAIRAYCKQDEYSVSKLIQELLTEFLNEVNEKEDLPSAQSDNRLSKIADLVDGNIDHFDLDDAMDLLYQIKDIVEVKGGF